jgi:phospholipid/cholesterol/gamma-HCH transport system substrate-binding protein
VNRGLWLGFLFLVALVLLGFATLVLQDLPLGTPVSLKVHFPRVQGLRKGDDVRVEGVLFGKVDAIELHRDAGVEVTLRLNRRITLYSDARVVVESTSVLGGTYVSIDRGTKEPALALDERTPLPGQTRGGLSDIGDVVDENRENFKELIRNLKDVTAALKSGQGSVGKAITSPELHDKAVAAVDQLRKVAETANERLRSEFIDATLANLHDTTQNLKSVTEKIDTGKGAVGALVSDPKTAEKVQKTLDNIEKTSDNLRSITDKVNKGEGTFGALVSDKDLGEKVKRTVDNIEKSSESIRSITEKLQNGEGSVGKLLQDDELYEKAKQTLDDIDKVFAKAARAIVEVAGDSKLYDDSGTHISKLGIRITPSEDKFIYVGAAFLSLDKEGEILFKNLVEDNESDTEIKGEVQVGYRVPWFLDRRLAVRGGLIEGKPGGAVELLWEDWPLFTHPIQLVFEFRDAYNDLDDEDIDEGLDGPLLRFYAKTPIWTRRDNWLELLLSTLRLYVGVSRIGEDPEGMIGIGLEWPDDDIRTLVSFVGLSR